MDENTFKQYHVEALVWSKHWERKAVSRTASKYQDCERIKLIRYRKPRDMELEEFQPEKKRKSRGKMAKQVQRNKLSAQAQERKQRKFFSTL